MWLDPLSGKLLSEAGLIPACQGRGPIVLMYHSISAGKGKPADQWCVSVKNFKNQLRLLKSEGWTTVLVHDLLMADSLPSRTVVITFDDGYADNFEYGFKLLAEYGMCATWFIVSQKIGQQLRLNAHQLKQMVVSGMEIGAHTRTHPRLPELEKTKIAEEVAGSKKDIEDILGLPVKSFAYPYGLFNDECVKAVRKAGFQIACTTRTGWFGSEPDIYRVRRVGIFANDSLSMFARKLAFAGNNVSWPHVANYFKNCIRNKMSRL